jgi:SsrA-binding protein
MPAGCLAQVGQPAVHNKRSHRVKTPQKIITQNKKARHEYEILDTMEAGIMLLGSEVKSCRMGTANLQDSYARLEKGELYLVNAHISAYKYANRFNHEPLRKRKLLLHGSELKKLYGKLREKGQTCIPLRLYFNERGKVKVEMALVRGKKLHDRREDIKKRDLQREAERKR